MDMDINSLKELLIALRYYIYEKDNVTSQKSILGIYSILDSVKKYSPQLFYFLFFSMKKIESMVASNEYEQAYDLVDCIHVVPDMILDNQNHWDEYWHIYVEVYINKWNCLSFMQFKDIILSLNL